MIHIDFIKKNTNKKARAYLVTYPSKEGPVPTLQWEALREGVDDVRYLTALKILLTRVKPDIAADINGVIERQLSDWGYAGAVNNGVQPFRADRFRFTREIVIKHILKLQE